MQLLKQQTLVQGIKTTVPPNYALSFSITPINLISDWGSIIHYTGDNTKSGPSGRIPGTLDILSSVV